MKNRFKVKYLSLLIVFLFTFVLSGCTSDIQSTNTNMPNEKENIVVSGKLKVHFIDVGQADSILIEQDIWEVAETFNGLMAIPNLIGVFLLSGTVFKLVKNYLMEQGVKTLEYVIGTHPHEDHIGGLDYVINDFNINKIYLPKATSTTKTFQDVVVAIKNKGMKASVPKPGESFNLGSAKCTILAPNSSEYSSLNNNSVVIKLEFGSNSFLFTGDAEDISEKEILAKGFNVKVDLLKVGHHGSRTSTTNEFLSKVNPKYAVISCAAENDYGHPHKETISKLKSKSIPIYRTDELGTIIATSDGKTITFNKKP